MFATFLCIINLFKITVGFHALYAGCNRCSPSKLLRSYTRTALHQQHFTSAASVSYASLTLFTASLPGFASLVRRSVKSKELRRRFEITLPSSKVASDISSHFVSAGYKAEPFQDRVVFTGTPLRTRAQAAFLSFCAFLTAGCMGLVLSTMFPAVGSDSPVLASVRIGDKAYLLTLLSPLTGWYYWANADRRPRTVSVRMEVHAADEGGGEEGTAEGPAVAGEGGVVVTVEGEQGAVEGLCRALRVGDPGMVYVKGLFETAG